MIVDFRLISTLWYFQGLEKQKIKFKDFQGLHKPCNNILVTTDLWMFLDGSTQKKPNLRGQLRLATERFMYPPLSASYQKPDYGENPIPYSFFLPFLYFWIGLQNCVEHNQIHLLG